MIRLTTNSPLLHTVWHHQIAAGALRSEVSLSGYGILLLSNSANAHLQYINTYRKFIFSLIIKNRHVEQGLVNAHVSLRVVAIVSCGSLTSLLRKLLLTDSLDNGCRSDFQTTTSLQWQYGVSDSLRHYGGPIMTVWSGATLRIRFDCLFWYPFPFSGFLSFVFCLLSFSTKLVFPCLYQQHNYTCWAAKQLDWYSINPTFYMYRILSNTWQLPNDSPNNNINQMLN